MTTALGDVAAYDYDLPETLIARTPLAARDASRMLGLDRQTGEVTHQRFQDFPTRCYPGDLVVLNNAKVMPARLIGHRQGHTGEVELFLLHPENADRTVWQILMRPAKRLKPGTIVCFPESALQAEILESLGEGRGRIRLRWPADENLDAMLTSVGQIPLPPYMARDPEPWDSERYQTVYARVNGAQAAPTAGLHFTADTLTALKARGVRVAEVTLYVSAGTFRPVLADQVSEHRMDAERYSIPPETAQAVAETRAAGNRIISIGTTVAKTLETSASRNAGVVTAESDWSELFITPGFPFQIVDSLLTNFHLPKSTLLMLVSAFAGRDAILAAYHEAIQQQYRFYSYGDCMLIA